MDKLSFTKILLLSVVVFSASVFSKRSAFNDLKGKISTCFRLCTEPESPCIGESTFVLVRVKKCWALPCCRLYCKGTTKPRYMSPFKMQWLRMLCQFLLKPEPVFRPSCLNSVWIQCLLWLLLLSRNGYERHCRLRRDNESDLMNIFRA